MGAHRVPILWVVRFYRPNGYPPPKPYAKTTTHESGSFVEELPIADEPQSVQGYSLFHALLDKKHALLFHYSLIVFNFEPIPSQSAPLEGTHLHRG